MLAIAMHRGIAVVAKIKAVQTFAVRFIVLKAQKRDGPHILVDKFPIHIANLELWIEIARLLDFKSITVLIVFAAHIAREGVAPVGPPEPGSLVLIEWQGLILQALAAIRLHGQVAIEDVVLLGALFHKVAIA